MVEQSRLSARRTLQKLGIRRSTFNRWYDRLLAGGIDALEDHKSRPSRLWNRIRKTQPRRGDARATVRSQPIIIRFDPHVEILV